MTIEKKIHTRMLIGLGTQWIYLGIIVLLEIEFKVNNNIYNAKISEIQYNYQH